MFISTAFTEKKAKTSWKQAFGLCHLGKPNFEQKLSSEEITIWDFEYVHRVRK